MIDLIDILTNNRNLEVIKRNDVTLIGHVPHVAEEAWFHSLYPGLSIQEIKQVEIKLNQQIPHVYIDFLKKYNGINIFNNSLSLFGYRNSYERTENVRQPFDLLIPNNYERISDSKTSFFYIGNYNWDGSLLYIDLTNPIKIIRCSRISSKPLNVWSSFIQMLQSEIERLEPHFDKDQIEIDEHNPTIPPPPSSSQTRVEVE